MKQVDAKENPTMVKKTKPTLLKTAAVVTIFRPCDMTKEGRQRIGKWLRSQARFLETKGDKMAKRFQARYHYVVRK